MGFRFRRRLRPPPVVSQAPVAAQPARLRDVPTLSQLAQSPGRNPWRWVWIVIGLAVGALYVLGHL